jgi:hypothetical protein
MRELPDITSLGAPNRPGAPFRIFRPDATPQQKRMAALLFGCLGLGLVLHLAGRLSSHGSASLLFWLGAALMAVPMTGLAIWAKIKAKHDPVLAEMMADARERAKPRSRKRLRFAFAQLAGLLFAIAASLGLSRFGLRIADMSVKSEFLLLFAAGTGLALLARAVFARRAD